MEIEKSLQVDAIRTRAQMQDRLVDVASADAYMRDPALQERVRQVWQGEDGDGSASELFVEGIFPAANGGASIDDLVKKGIFSPIPHDSPHLPAIQVLRRFAPVPYHIGELQG